MMTQKILLLSCALCIAALSATGESPTYSADSDYLSAELRAKVEALKVAAVKPPRTREETVDRATTLWYWSKEFSRRGGQVNPLLPLAVGLLADPNLAAAPQAILMRNQLKGLVADMALKEEHPDALGHARLSPRGPFPAASFQTIRQTYTVGEKPLGKGAKILCGREFSSDHGAFQNSDPAADNYLSISSSNPDVAFVPTPVNMFGPHATLVLPAPIAGFRVTAGTMEPGDTFTITYGDTTGGGQGFQVNHFAAKNCALPLYIDFGGRNTWHNVPWETYAVDGVDAVKVHAFAPSIVKTNSPAEIHIRFEDQFRNLATGPTPELDIFLNGDPFGKLEATSDGSIITKQLSFDKSGVYQLVFKRADGTVMGHCTPILVKDNPAQGIFWGDTHAHIGFSEGVGGVDEFFDYAFGYANLDFVSLTEHDIMTDDYEWGELVRGTNQYLVPGKNITYLGYEWSANVLAGGHHNVMFRTTTQERVPVQTAPLLQNLYDGLNASNDADDVVVIPHAHTPGDWTRSDAGLERASEITSMHGSFEWFARNYLKQGHKVGFVGASDDHRAQPGYSGTARQVLMQNAGLGAVLAPAKTKDGIFDAMRARHTYATTGQRFILDLTMNGEEMGSILKQVETRRIAGKIIGSYPINIIEVVKNGEVIHSEDRLSSSLASSCQILISFESESDPLVRDTPRGNRTWDGSLTLSDGRLTGLDVPDFENYNYEFARIDSDNPNTVVFYDRTRGQSDTMVLHVARVSENSSITISLNASEEGARVLAVNNRAAQKFDAQTVTIPFSELRNGKTRREFNVGEYTDTITIQVVSPQASIEQDFAFEDTDTTPGDYYYVRTVQLDGGIAWSSPWWVE